MAREREARLSVPPVFRLDELDGLADGAVTRAEEPSTSTTTYVDTDDLRLARWGVSLRHREGDGWTVSLPAEAAPGAAGVERSFPGGVAHVAGGALDLVSAYLRSAAVAPVARLRTLRRCLAVEGPGGEAMARVLDDEVSILAGRRVAGRFRELVVSLAEAGDPGLLDAIVERLVAAGAGPPDPTPRYVRAVGARALAPAEVDAAAQLEAGASAAAAVGLAIAHSVSRLLRHDPGVRLGDDPEDVHQARVATRRLRSDLRTFGPLLDPDWADRVRGELGWIAADLGEVRDAEVLSARLAARVEALPARERAVGARLIEALDGRRGAGRERLLAAMRSPRYQELLDALVGATIELPATPAAAAPAAEALPPLAVAPWRKLRRAVRALADPPTDVELHGVRIRAKRCRYAAEAVAPVAGPPAADFARAVARVQEVLGEHHDACVARSWLRERAGRGAAAFAAGELAGLELVAATEARERWPRAWRRARRRRLRHWM